MDRPIPKPAPPKAKTPSPETVVVLDEIKDISDSLLEEVVKSIPLVDTDIPKRKKPFVPQEHLTQKPFRENSALGELKKSLENKNSQEKKR